jgi:hypothetical protein
MAGVKFYTFLISTVIVLSFMIDESVFAIPIVGIAEIGDYFGSSVAAGDFDGDGLDDLAVGVPEEDLQIDQENTEDTGVVNVIYGSQGSGLTATGNQVWHQDSDG